MRSADSLLLTAERLQWKPSSLCPNSARSAVDRLCDYDFI